MHHCVIAVELAFLHHAQKMQACLISRLGMWVCRFLVQLSQPALSYLMDHIVAGRSLLPGAAMFEATTAAGCTLAEKSSVDLCLADISIPSPVVMQSGVSQELACIVNVNRGTLALQGNMGSAPGEASCIRWNKSLPPTCNAQPVYAYCWPPLITEVVLRNHCLQRMHPPTMM